VAFAGSGMGAVIAQQFEVLVGYCAYRLGLWQVFPPGRDQARLYLCSGSIAQQSRADMKRDGLRQGGWHGVTDLPLDRGKGAQDFVVVGHGLQAAQLAGRETAVLPMERTSSRTGLGGEGPGRLVLGQLEEEVPETATPAEQR